MTNFHPPTLLRRGFSLIEILFAIFILGIGLLMIAAVFPIAIKWTNQDVQSTIGLVISRSAVAQIKANFTASGESAFAENFSSDGGTTPPLPTQALPVLATYPQPYLYGTPNPTPSVGLLVSPPNTPPDYADYDGLANYYTKATYWWQAIMVPAPADGASGVAPTPNGAAQAGTNTYNLYILVFEKGDVSNQYNSYVASPPPAQVPQIEIESAGAAAADPSMPIGAIGLDLKPVPYGASEPVTYSADTVRKEIINPPAGSGNTTPEIGFSGAGVGAGDAIIFAPPAVNQQKSPLVYIYATTVTF